MSTEKKSSSSEKIQFLESKIEALQLEVSYLSEQNVKLSDQLEHMRKINSRLKQRLTSTANVISSSKSISGEIQRNSRRATTTVLSQGKSDKSDKKISSKDDSALAPIEEKELDIEDERNEKSDVHSLFLLPGSIKDEDLAVSTPDIRITPAQERGDIGMKTEDAPFRRTGSRKLSEAIERCSQKIEEDELHQIKIMLKDVLENPKRFYEINNIVKVTPYSPFSKMEIHKAEKYIEGTEHMVRKWTKQLEDMYKNCHAYTKCVENFGNQLLVDKSFFGPNIELQNLLMLIAQVLEEHAMYLEVFSQTLENSVRIPLKQFYKEDLRSFKEPKKKMQKAWEELEISQAKYMTTKKSLIMKDTISGQTLLKSYLNSVKGFEIARLEYINYLNDLNVQINIELVEKLCTLVTGRMVHFNSAHETLISLEKQFNLLEATIPQKTQIQEDLDNEIKQKIEMMVKDKLTEFSSPSIPDMIKEGYLFIKMDNKDFKKKYCIIPADGVLYWVKEQETGEPHILEIANLKLCSVKPRSDPDHNFCFELVDALMKKPIVVQADSEASMNEWITTIQNVTERFLSTETVSDNGPPQLLKVNSDGSRVKSVSQKSLGSVENGTTDLQSQSAKQTLISFIMKQNICADCGASDPSWLSLNLGVIVCIQCSGVHRQLGPTISKVRSFKLDNLNMAIVRLFSKLCTRDVNKVWEGLLEETATLKPNPTSEKEKRIEWVRLKYVDRALVRPLKEEDHIGALIKALQEKDLLKTLNVLAYTKKNLNDTYMIEGRKQTLLHYACAKSSLEIVELLIRNGCDIQADDQENLKPIDCAMLANNIEVVEHLIGSSKNLEI